MEKFILLLHTNSFISSIHINLANFNEDGFIEFSDDFLKIAEKMKIIRKLSKLSIFKRFIQFLIF